MITPLISQLIPPLSQSSDSYERTDGRTNGRALTREGKVDFRNAHRGASGISSVMAQ